MVNETRGSIRDRVSIVYPLLLIPGALLLLSGLVAIYWYMSFENRGVITKGTVIEVEYVPVLSVEDSSYYNAIVEFRTTDGQLVRFKEKHYEAHVGNKVDVLYDPSNPSEVMVYSSGYMYIWSILASFGAGFLFFALWGWLGKRKSQRQHLTL